MQYKHVNRPPPSSLGPNRKETFALSCLLKAWRRGTHLIIHPSLPLCHVFTLLFPQPYHSPLFASLAPLPPSPLLHTHSSSLSLAITLPFTFSHCLRIFSPSSSLLLLLLLLLLLHTLSLPQQHCCVSSLRKLYAHPLLFSLLSLRLLRRVTRLK